MAEQGRTVMPTVGATGSKGQLTNTTVKVYNNSKNPGTMDLKSFLGHPSSSGFTANQRPAVYYRPGLDVTDNPQFGRLLSDSFMSQTKQHYQPHIQSDCSLPNIVNKTRESGFHQLRSHPKTATVEDKTEYQRLFVPHPLTPKVSWHQVTVGPKGKTGFIEETNVQLNTFQVEPHLNLSSVMKSDFTPPSILQGNEVRPGLCGRSTRETGYTQGRIAPLAWPTSLLPSPQTESHTPTERIIGKKEPTGSLLNAPNDQIFPNTPFDCSHFTTHYRSTFCQEKLKTGHTCAGIISSKMDNGYNRRDMDRFILRG